MQHHATIFLTSSNALDCLPAAYRTHSVDRELIVFDTFKIDAVRNLQAVIHRRPLIEKKRSFVIMTQRITSEAQNALLKILEEPPSHVIFFIILPSDKGLLPTLRSRVQIITNTNAPIIPLDFTHFLQASLAERIATIASLAKKKDYDTMQNIIFGSEQYALTKVNDRTMMASEVVCICTYFSQSGAAKKMLLETLALILPVKK